MIEVAEYARDVAVWMVIGALLGELTGRTVQRARQALVRRDDRP